MSIKMSHGYAARAVGAQLEPFEFAPQELKADEVRVAVSHCGICHTDLHAIDNYYNVVTYPFVPGHEIVGKVSEVGRSVTGFKVGERVGIGWQGHPCGQCEWCLRGEPQLCMKVEETGVWTPYGGFSDSVFADQRFVHPLPAGMPSESAAVLMCAGITVYAALRNQDVQPGMRIGIVGVGGLGHLAIQYAHALGCEVTALSSSPEKEPQARAFGADTFTNTGDITAVRKIHYSLDLVLCTANAGFNWESLLMTVKKRGKLVLAGFPDVTMNSTDLVVHELTIAGSFLGRPEAMGDMLYFSQEHGIKPMVELIPMSRINEAVKKVRENKARYRVVLVNDGVDHL